MRAAARLQVAARPQQPVARSTGCASHPIWLRCTSASAAAAACCPPCSRRAATYAWTERICKRHASSVAPRKPSEACQGGRGGEAGIQLARAEKEGALAYCRGKGAGRQPGSQALEPATPASTAASIYQSP